MTKDCERNTLTWLSSVGLDTVHVLVWRPHVKRSAPRDFRVFVLDVLESNESGILSFLRGGTYL